MGGIDQRGRIARIMNKDVNETFAQSTDSLEAIAEAIAALVGSGYQDGAVWYDENSGITGTAPPYGTPFYPVNSEADARTIAIANNLTRIRIAGSFTVPDTMEGYTFLGGGRYNLDDTVLFNGQDVDGCSFINCAITGTNAGGGLITVYDGYIYSTVDMQGAFFNCMISSASLAAGGVIDLHQPVGWQGALTLTVGTPNPLNLFGWRGDLTLASQTGGTTNIYSNGANITINNTCNGGTINIYGEAVITDNSAGTTVNDYSSHFSLESDGTFSHPSGVAEQTAFTITSVRPTKVNSIYLDMVNLTQNATIRIKYQIDGTNYRTIETFNWTVGMDDGVYFREITVNDNVQVTVQSAVAEGVARDIPYQYFQEE